MPTSQDALPIRTQRNTPLHHYWRARREAHAARLADAELIAIAAENRAGALLDAAAEADADATTWATLVEACDEAASASTFDPTTWNSLIELPKPTRAELIAKVDNALGVDARTSPEQCATLAQKGYVLVEAQTWGAWIVDNAEEYGVAMRTAITLFDLLGPDEAFDGFVTGLQDAEEAE